MCIIDSSKVTKSDNLKWSAFQYESLEGIKIREVSTCPTAYHVIAISEDFKVSVGVLTAKDS